MEFKVNSKELEKILSKLIIIVPTRSSIASLEYFLFELDENSLVIQSTDISTTVRSKLTVHNTSGENIELLLPAKLLYDFVKNIGDVELTFVMTNDKVTVSFDKGFNVYSPLKKDDYHSINKVENPKTYTFDGVALRKSFELTSFAASTEEVRPSMTGVLIEFTEESLNFVATDGHRLVKYSKPSEDKKEVNEQYVIPAKVVNALTKLIPDSQVVVNFGASLVSFEFDDTLLVSRIIGDKYPNYNSVIPLQNDKVLTVNTSELKSALRRMINLNSQIKLTLEVNNLILNAEDINRGVTAKEDVDCTYTDDKMEIGFNSNLLFEELSHINSEKVLFKFSTPTKACIIKPEETKDEELLLLLMPVRLNN